MSEDFNPDLSVENKDQHEIAVIRKRWFQGKGSLFIVVFFGVAMLIFWTLVVLLFAFEPPDSPLTVCVSIFAIIVVLVTTAFFLISLGSARAATVRLTDSSIGILHGRVLDKEIQFGSDVTADVVLKKDGGIDYLKGFKFTQDDSILEIDIYDGWTEQDLLNIWQPLVKVLDARGVNMAESMVAYSEALQAVEGHPLSALNKGRFKSNERTDVDVWIHRIEEDPTPTKVAREYIEKVIKEGIEEPTRRWNRLERFHPAMTFSRLMLLISLFLVPILINTLSGPKGISGVLEVLFLTVLILSPVIFIFTRWTIWYSRYFEAEANVKPEDAFLALVGVFQAQGRSYEINTNKRSMPSRRGGIYSQHVSFQFKIDGKPYTLDVCGVKESRLYLGEKPKEPQASFEEFLDHTSIALRQQEMRLVTE